MTGDTDRNGTAHREADQDRPVCALALGELDWKASRPQQASDSRAQLCVLRYN